MKALSTIALASLFLIPAAYADHHGDKIGFLGHSKVRLTGFPAVAQNGRF